MSTEHSAPEGADAELSTENPAPYQCKHGCERDQIMEQNRVLVVNYDHLIRTAQIQAAEIDHLRKDKAILAKALDQAGVDAMAEADGPHFSDLAGAFKTHYEAEDAELPTAADVRGLFKDQEPQRSVDEVRRELDAHADAHADAERAGRGR